MKNIEEYPKPLQKILYKIFKEHLQTVDITYNSCKIESLYKKMKKDASNPKTQKYYKDNLEEIDLEILT